MCEGRFCATLFRTARKSLILNGEMSEWSIEHAWKACVGETLPRVRIPLSRARSFSLFFLGVSHEISQTRGRLVRMHAVPEDSPLGSRARKPRFANRSVRRFQV